MPNRQTAHAGNPPDQAEPESMWTDLGRAFAGALIFSISLIMTMETWSLGFATDRWRLAIFVCANLALLVGLAHYRGFRKTQSQKHFKHFRDFFI